MLWISLMERSLMVAESSWLKKAVDVHVLEAAANPDHEAEIVQDPSPDQGICQIPIYHFFASMILQ